MTSGAVISTGNRLIGQRRRLNALPRPDYDPDLPIAARADDIVAALVEALDGWQDKDDPGDRLNRYSRRRWSDSVLVAGGIHAINEARTLGELGKHALGAGFTAMRLARPGGKFLCAGRAGWTRSGRRSDCLLAN